jgi:hypothetical protein
MLLSLSWSQQAIYGTSGRKWLAGVMITKDFCTYIR